MGRLFIAEIRDCHSEPPAGGEESKKSYAKKGFFTHKFSQNDRNVNGSFSSWEESTTKVVSLGKRQDYHLTG